YPRARATSANCADPPRAPADGGQMNAAAREVRRAPDRSPPPAPLVSAEERTPAASTAAPDRGRETASGSACRKAQPMPPPCASPRLTAAPSAPCHPCRAPSAAPRRPPAPPEAATATRSPAGPSHTRSPTLSAPPLLGGPAAARRRRAGRPPRPPTDILATRRGVSASP